MKKKMLYTYASTPDRTNLPSQPGSTPEQVNEKDARRFEETDKKLQELRELIDKMKKGDRNR
jgi:hypothetical protein